MSSYCFCAVKCYTLFYRFVVALKWFEKWKKYVGFESFDRGFTGKKEYFPGSIDNSALFKSVELF